jgi:pyruvate formate lyase activating enzyme
VVVSPVDDRSPASGDVSRVDHRNRCLVCGACVETCPAAALRVVGKAYAVDELVAELLRDQPFYRASGGGVTFSGGEPTMHLGYLAEVAARLHAASVHLLLETCGLYQAKAFEASLLPALDAIYFDVKLADDTLHRRHTGASNRVILANLRRLVDRGLRGRVLPRVPLVPGLTDTDDNLQAIAGLLCGLGFAEVALLPYNPLRLAKCRELGREPRYASERFMERAEIERCRQVVQRAGLAVR